MTGEKLHQSYKSLQGEFTKRTEKLKSLEGSFTKYGGAEGLTKWAEYLMANPRFAEWVKEEQRIQNLGSDEGYDENTKKAMYIVERIADQRIEEALRERLEPISESYKQETLSRNMSKMDTEHPGWRELQEKMVEIGETMPPEVQDSPSFRDLETIYIRALLESGKFEDVMAASYEKKLKAAQGKAAGAPAKTGGVTTFPKKFSSMREAFESAKKQAG